MAHRPLTNTCLKFTPEDVPAKDPTSPEYVPARSVCFISKL